MIDGLLKIDMNERYGCGLPGSNNDITALKNHPFFKDINFETLPSTAPPTSCNQACQKLKNSSPRKMGTYKL